MSGPQDVGIRQRARGGPSGRSSQAQSPISEPDDDHLAAYRAVSDTYLFRKGLCLLTRVFGHL